MTHVAEVSATARHAELYLHAVVARLLPRLSDAQEAAPWLDDYRALSGVNWDQEIAELEADSGERLPLAQLSRDDALVLMAAGLIEEDIRFGSLFAALQDPLAARRPCFGLLGWLLAGAATTAGDVLERCQRLAMAGLIVIDNKADPRSEWIARLPVPLWDLLRGGTISPSSLPPSLTLRTADSFPPLERRGRATRTAGAPSPHQRPARHRGRRHARGTRTRLKRPPHPARVHRPPPRA